MARRRKRGPDKADIFLVNLTCAIGLEAQFRASFPEANEFKLDALRVAYYQHRGLWSKIYLRYNKFVAHKLGR